MRAWFTILVTLTVLNCGGADDYYRHFIDAAATNNSKLHRIDSPFLIDTTKAASKLTNAVVNLGSLLTNGEICRIRLGMTMDEVVARWGKPRAIWSRCYFPYPTFMYLDAALGFKGNSLEGVSLVGVKPFVREYRWRNSDSTQSVIEECLRCLGPAKSRKDSNRRCQLIYEASDIKMSLDFSDGEMDSLRLERSTTNSTPKK